MRHPVSSLEQQTADGRGRDEQPAACGPLRTVVVRVPVQRSARQRRGRAGRRSASARRSPLRSDSPAARARGPGLRQARTVHRTVRVRAQCIVPVARRTTHCAHCVRCVRTSAPSQSTKRAARAATSPALLGASQARCDGLPAPAFVEALAVRGRIQTTGSARQAVSVGGDLWGDEERRLGVGARSALRGLTRRTCPNAANAVSAVSCATRPRAEHRSAVGAKRRPPHHEPPADTACRAPRTSAQEREQRLSAMGRKRTVRHHGPSKASPRWFRKA